MSSSLLRTVYCYLYFSDLCLHRPPLDPAADEEMPVVNPSKTGLSYSRAFGELSFSELTQSL